MLSTFPMIAAASLLAPGVHAGLFGQGSSVRTTGMGAIDSSKVDRHLTQSCTPPSATDRLSEVLQVSKLQCPDSGTETRELTGYCSDQFFMSGEYMNFETDAERCELRTPFDPVNNVNVNFKVSDVQAKIESTVSLPNKEIGDGNYYTWMQIHGDDTSYVRLTHYGLKEGLEDYLWLYLKTGSSSSYDFESIEMVPMPSGDFQASLTLNAGRLTVACDGWSQTYDTDWSDENNYFKMGIYADGGNPTDYPVLYKNLLYEGPMSDSVTSVQSTPADPVFEEEADAPAPEVDDEEDAVAPAPDEDDDEDDADAPAPDEDDEDDVDAPDPADDEDEDDADAPEPDEDDEDDDEDPAPAPDDDDDMNTRTESPDGDEAPVSAPEPASDEAEASAPEEEETEEAPAPGPDEENDADMKKKKGSKTRCKRKNNRRRSKA